MQLPSPNQHHRRLRRCFSIKISTTAVFAAEHASSLACNTKQTQTHTGSALLPAAPLLAASCLLRTPDFFSWSGVKRRPRNSAAVHCPAVTWPTCPAGRRLRGCPLPCSDMADLPSRRPLAPQARLPRKPACPASAVQTDMPIALTTQLSASAAAWPCAREVLPLAGFSAQTSPIGTAPGLTTTGQPLQAQPGGRL